MIPDFLVDSEVLEMQREVKRLRWHLFWGRFLLPLLYIWLFFATIAELLFGDE